MATRQDVNSPLLITIGAISAILVLTIIVGVQAWVTSEQNEENARKDAASPNVWLDNLHAQQQANLNKERWIDRDKKIVQIPIGLAMKLIVENKGMMPSTQPSAAPQKSASAATDSPTNPTDESASAAR